MLRGWLLCQTLSSTPSISWISKGSSHIKTFRSLPGDDQPEERTFTLYFLSPLPFCLAFVMADRSWPNYLRNLVHLAVKGQHMATFPKPVHILQVEEYPFWSSCGPEAKRLIQSDRFYLEMKKASKPLKWDTQLKSPHKVILSILPKYDPKQLLQVSEDFTEWCMPLNAHVFLRHPIPIPIRRNHWDPCSPELSKNWDTKITALY